MSKTLINGEYAFEYLPTGKKVYKSLFTDKVPNLCLCGGFGSSKTRTGLELLFEAGIVFPGIEIGIFRKHRIDVKATDYKDFLDDVCPPEYIGYHNKAELNLKLLNSSDYRFFGIDKFLAKGSLKFDIIFVDEGIEVTMEDIIMLQGRLRGKHIEVPLLFICTNAGFPDSPLYKLFVKNESLPPEKKDNDYKYFSVNSFENIHNPPAYHKRLAKWEGTPYYDRFVLALWKNFEGLVYSNFDREKMEIDPFEIPPYWVKKTVIDFGYTIEHPLVILWFTQDPVTEVWYLYRQFYKTGVLIRNATKFGKDISDKYNEFISEAMGDHDAEGRAEWEEDWMYLTPARKGIKNGIQRVLEAITDDKLRIFKNDVKEGYGLVDKDLLLEEAERPTCFQEEVPLYVWGTNDEPVKDFDHACDCVRYLFETEHYYSMVGKSEATPIKLIKRK